MPSDIVPVSDSELADLGLERSRLPQHVAIIMDGNGRWAESRGLDRSEGHRAGAVVVRDIVRECGRLGIDYLTLYSFSIENWKRPADEVAALMALLLKHLGSEESELLANDVRLVHLGRRDGLPRPVLEALDQVIERTRDCTGLTLALALNYGSRTEIVDAVQAIAQEAANGVLEPSAIDERVISDHLYTAGMPDPDLLIRTAGEMRVSNYLLWQISYAELHVTDLQWPEFGVEGLHQALQAYASRHRRFGAIG